MNMEDKTEQLFNTLKECMKELYNQKNEYNIKKYNYGNIRI